MALLSSFFRRTSLHTLFNLDDRRLSDLGLNRYDLFDAKRSGQGAALLAERRDERAHNWLR